MEQRRGGRGRRREPSDERQPERNAARRAGKGGKGQRAPRRAKGEAAAGAERGPRERRKAGSEGRGGRLPGPARQSAQGDAATGRAGGTPPPKDGRPGGRDSPALPGTSGRSPPRSWGAPVDPAPYAPRVSPRPPRQTDPDPNPADRAARAFRVALRLRHVGSRPAHRSRPSHPGDSAARLAATAQAYGGGPAS